MGGEIISADSRQVYRRMDIGTGKDLAEYSAWGKPVPFHLIDIREPGDKYNVFEFQRDFLGAYNSIRTRGAVPIMCGGTGLYLEAVLRGYRMHAVPENRTLRESLSGRTLEELATLLARIKHDNGSAMHNTTDVDTVKRAVRAIEIEVDRRRNPAEERAFPDIPSLTVGVAVERAERRRRISQRLRERLDGGLVEEIRGLLDSGVNADGLIYYGLEYKYVTWYVLGKMSYDDMLGSLETAIHQFAKRQMTWFRGMERRGIPIHWIDAELPMEEKVSIISRLWNAQR